MPREFSRGARNPSHSTVRNGSTSTPLMITLFRNANRFHGVPAPYCRTARRTKNRWMAKPDSPMTPPIATPSCPASARSFQRSHTKNPATPPLGVANAKISFGLSKNVEVTIILNENNSLRFSVGSVILTVIRPVPPLLPTMSKDEIANGRPEASGMAKDRDTCKSINTPSSSHCMSSEVAVRRWYTTIAPDITAVVVIALGRITFVLNADASKTIKPLKISDRSAITAARCSLAASRKMRYLAARSSADAILTTLN